MKPLQAGDPASVGEGRYRLVGRLGQGGMGVVYFGRSRSGRAVAVKVVRPELSTEPGFRRRFADEVAAARRVGGFHTAPVVDADPEGEPAWLVTAYVPGPTLQILLDQVGPLPVDTLTVLAAGLAEALAAIHQAGVIHRDLKPANIIVAEDGPRVIDFGIARALDGTAITQTGFQIGTLGFLSPEQLTGGTLTPAVDLFALGVVLCQAAGVTPFGDGGSPAWPYRVVHEQPDLTGVPGRLRELVAACLAKDPRDRPGPLELLNHLTVERLSDVWLPAEATALVRRQVSGASFAAGDRAAGAAADPRAGLSVPRGGGEGVVGGAALGRGVSGGPVVGGWSGGAADPGAVLPGEPAFGGADPGPGVAAGPVVGGRSGAAVDPGAVSSGEAVVGQGPIGAVDPGRASPGPVVGAWPGAGVDRGPVSSGEPVVGERPGAAVDPGRVVSTGPVVGNRSGATVDPGAVSGEPVFGDRPATAVDRGPVASGEPVVGDRPATAVDREPVVSGEPATAVDRGPVVCGEPVAGERPFGAVDPGRVAWSESAIGEQPVAAADQDLRPRVPGPPTADAWPPAVATPPTPAEGPAVTSRPRTVRSSPNPGFGPAPDYSRGPIPQPTSVPDPGGSGAVGGGQGRRGTLAVAALLVAAATAGVLVWHPWSGAGGDDTGAGASSSSSSPRRSTPAAFPNAPLLVRMDTDPGSSTCHSVIGRRDSTKDDPKQLIDGTCDALPQWSPDHKSFAFTRKTAQESAVWTANADGTGVRRVAAISGGRVSWSPDGKRLAVLRRDGDGVQQLFVVTVSDGSAQRLTTGSAKVEDPAWSPDGKQIAVCIQKTSGWQIHVVDPARPGAEPRQVTHQSRRALDPVWSPDGRYFAYTAGAPGIATGGDIHIVKADGTDDRTLVQTAAQEMDPVWSPDGTWVAYVRGPFDQPAVWAVRADGTGARRLTTGSTPEGHPSWR